MPQSISEFCVQLANSGRIQFTDNDAKNRFITDCQNNPTYYGYDPNSTSSTGTTAQPAGTLPGFGGPANNSPTTGTGSGLATPLPTGTEAGAASGTSGGTTNTGVLGSGSSTTTTSTVNSTCPEFVLSDPLPSISCFVRSTAIYTGVNLIAFVVVVLGLWLLFRPEIEKTVDYAANVAKKSAKDAETAAEVAA